MEFCSTVPRRKRRVEHALDEAEKRPLRLRRDDTAERRRIMTAASKPLPDAMPKTPINARPDRNIRLSNLPAAAGYAVATITVSFATLVGMALDGVTTVPNLSLVFVLPVILTAVFSGIGPTLAAAVLGALSFNFFFTAPRYTLQVDDPANIWAIGLLFAVGCIASTIAFTSQRSAAEAERRRLQAITLQTGSRAVVAATDPKVAISAALDACENLFGVPTVLMVVPSGEPETICRRGRFEPEDAELEAARSALALTRFTPASVYPFDSSRFDFWPAATEEVAVAIGIAFEPGERPDDAGPLVETLAGLLLLRLTALQAAQNASRKA
jgi:two-component system sensor histidine kinase KdpD